MSYLGKSAYPGDALYQGEVSALHVYDEALSADDVALVAETDAAASAGEAVTALDLQAANTQHLSRIETDIVLPTAGGISWTSEPAGIIADDGSLSQPAEQTSVTLTATATVHGQSASRDIEVTVLGEPSPAERAERAVAGIVLPSVVENGYRLPDSALGLPVSWSLVNGEGTVEDGVIDAAPASGLAPVTLEAVAGTGADTATSTIEVRVAEDTGHTLASYTTSASTRGGSDPEVTLSGHLALSEDGQRYTALNSGAGVVFPRVTGMTEHANGTKRYLEDPYLFRLEGEEGFGLVARRVAASGSPSGDDQRHLHVFTSPDLVQWTELDPLVLPGAGAVGGVATEWDERHQAYRVLWTDPAGLTVSALTEDLTELTVLGPAHGPEGRSGEIDVRYANPATVVPLTADEARSAEQLLGRVANTGVDAPPDVSLAVGDELDLPDQVTARYSDGGSYDFPVTWDEDAVDTSTPGEYEVTGTLGVQDTVFPLLPNRADPHMMRYTMPGGEQTWLYIATDDDGQDELFIRQADAIENITTAPDHRILGIGLSGTAPVGSQLWAPELHEVDGDLYILFAANSENVNYWGGVQAYTMRLTPGGDPLAREDWEEPQRVVDADGEVLTEYGTGITLDMTYFEDDGTPYVMWSERRVPAGSIGPAVLKIATVETLTDGPWRLSSERSTVTYPDLGWSGNTTEVVEGPFAIQRDGRVMITFSGSGVDWTYGVGMMTADSGADLLDPASWQTRSYPIWHYEGPVADNWGPGHNAYAYDEHGNLFNIFHAKATQHGSRDSGARMVYFRTDGSPILDMTDEEWLSEQHREVSVRVTVDDDAAAELSVTAQPRCVVGKVAIAAQVATGDEPAADLAITSSYGSRTVAQLDAGRGTAAAFSSRRTEVPAGEVSVAATVAGESVTASASYPAHSCG